MTDEHLLIMRAQGGDMEAFRELVERSRIKVFRLAYDLTGSRHDAEDLSQDVFVKAFRSLSTFRGAAKWSTWLYRITVNACLDHRRSASAETTEFRDDIGSNEMESAHSHERKTITPDRATESSLIQQNIERALSQLAPQERSVFVLRHYHDLPLKQIADTLQVAEGTVKSYLFRAVQRLQQELSFYRRDLGLEKRQ